MNWRRFRRPEWYILSDRRATETLHLRQFMGGMQHTGTPVSDDGRAKAP
jgi:hypothetical protein